MNLTVERPAQCHKCTSDARFAIGSAASSGSLACSLHLPDRISYELGRSVRVDVRRVEVTA